jgi:hypothetical protein
VNVAVDVGVAVLGGDGSEHSAAASNQRRDGGPLGLVRLQNGRLVACLWFGEDSSREWEGSMSRRRPFCVARNVDGFARAHRLVRPKHKGSMQGHRCSRVQDELGRL